MDKTKIVESWNKIKSSVKDGLETARSHGVPKKIVIVIGGISLFILSAFLLLRILGNLFDAIAIFVDRHFFGVAGTLAAGSWIVSWNQKRKEEKARLLLEKQKGADSQRERFVKGAYPFIGRFLFSEICTAPNFADLTSCQRPIRPEDMGVPELDSYIYHGIMYCRYSLPKMRSEFVDISLLKSILQGMLDEKIRTRGLPPILPRGNNRGLYIDKVEDMQNYVSVILVLNFDDNYVSQIAYENAMNEVINRSQQNKILEDIDYHG